MARLFHISDIHFGREDVAAVAWFEACVAAERPDAVIITGDLTMRARSAEYEAAGAWLQRLGVPLSIEPGNHDLPYYNPFRRFFSPYHRYERIERALERPFDVPGVWLVPLRTTARAQWRLNWSWGAVNRRSLADALARLAECPPDHVAIVACHHPLIEVASAEGHGRTLRGDTALKALAEAGADAVAERACPRSLRRALAGGPLDGAPDRRRHAFGAGPRQQAFLQRDRDRPRAAEAQRPRHARLTKKGGAGIPAPPS